MRVEKMDVSTTEADSLQLTESSNFSNISLTLDTDDVDKFIIRPAPFIVMAPALMIYFGNTLVILSVYFSPLLKEWTYYFIVNLAVSDLSTGFCCISGVLITGARYLFSGDSRKCELAFAPYVFTTCSSAFALVIISADRYLLICRPLAYATWVQPSRAVPLIALGWIIALAITSIPLMLPSVEPRPSVCAIEDSWPYWYVLSVLMVVYLLPLVSISWMYTRIGLVALHHRRAIEALQPQPLADPANNQNPSEPPQEPTQHVQDASSRSEAAVNDEPQGQDGKAKWKVTRTVLILTGYYTLSWLPFFANLTLLTMKGQ